MQRYALFPILQAIFVIFQFFFLSWISYKVLVQVQKMGLYEHLRPFYVSEWMRAHTQGNDVEVFFALQYFFLSLQKVKKNKRK